MPPNAQCEVVHVAAVRLALVRLTEDPRVQSATRRVTLNRAVATPDFHALQIVCWYSIQWSISYRSIGVYRCLL